MRFSSCSNSSNSSITIGSYIWSGPPVRPLSHGAGHHRPQPGKTAYPDRLGGPPFPDTTARYAYTTPSARHGRIPATSSVQNLRQAPAAHYRTGRVAHLAVDDPQVVTLAHPRGQCHRQRHDEPHVRLLVGKLDVRTGGSEPPGADVHRS